MISVSMLDYNNDLYTLKSMDTEKVRSPQTFCDASSEGLDSIC